MTLVLKPLPADGQQASASSELCGAWMAPVVWEHVILRAFTYSELGPRKGSIPPASPCLRDTGKKEIEITETVEFSDSCWRSTDGCFEEINDSKKMNF